MAGRLWYGRGRLLALLLLCLVATTAQAASAGAEGLEIRLDDATGDLALLAAEEGAIAGPLSLGLGAPREASLSADGATLTARYGRGVSLRATVGTPAGHVRLALNVPAGVEGLRLEGPATMGDDPILGWARDDRAGDRSVLTLTLGHAAVPGARTLFDRNRDLAVTVTGPGARFEPAGGAAGGYRLVVDLEPGTTDLDLRVRRHYYRDTLGIRYYAPLSKRSYWKTAPCVAMTWYGIRAYTVRPAQTLDRLTPELDWARDHLLPYDPSLIFQLDDSYDERSDATMRGLSEAIRARGMIPGVWFTPFTVAPNELESEHPEWFLHGADGAALNTFGGIIYHGRTLNVTNTEAVRAWYGRWWEKVCETWGFEFFKIDGQPEVVAAYARAKDADGVESYREGLRIGRAAVGADRFINGCWGTPVEGIGILDGSRTGGDTGDFPHAIDVVIRWNYLNNVAWWCDPDAAANLAHATVERVRLNTQARTLTGQQFLTDDLWSQVPAETAYVWQRGMPNADIRPANLYQIEDWQRYDTFDLKIRREFGQWDAVGLFNYEGAPAEKVLDLGRLGLAPGRYHVYDAWARTYVGCLPADGLVPVALQPYEGRLYSVRRAEGDRPMLLSTARHITQGGLDLESVREQATGEGWTLAGRSTHLVAGDPYSLAFHAGRWRVAGCRSSAGTPTVTYVGPVAHVTLPATAAGAVRWTVEFAPRTGAALAPAVTEIDLGELGPGAEASASLPLLSLGPESVAWRVEESPAWCGLAPEGSLGPAPSEAVVVLQVSTEGLPAATEFTGVLRLRAGSEEPVAVTVRFRTGFPDDLARRAIAAASSAWGPDYGPENANDGDPATRWNSGKGETAGAWLELAWPEPTAVDTVVVEEAIVQGYRVRGWVLEAERDGRWQAVAEGTGLGARRRIDLGEPVTARRLRLVVRQASDVPTIQEISAYCRTAR